MKPLQQRQHRTILLLDESSANHETSDCDRELSQSNDNDNIKRNINRMYVKHFAPCLRHQFSGIVSFCYGFICSTVLWWLYNQVNGTNQFGIIEHGRSCQISYGTFRGIEYINHESTVLKPKCIFESKYLKLQQHQVRLDGAEVDTIIPDWIWIDYHNSINVLVEAPTDATKKGDNYDEQLDHSKKEYLLFEQTKYGLDGKLSLAVVGGIIEPNEDPEQTARREINEELGVTCKLLHFLGQYRTDVNRGMGWTFTYLATKCSYNSTGPMNDDTGKSTIVAGRETGDTKLTNEVVGGVDTEKQVIRLLKLDELKSILLNATSGAEDNRVGKRILEVKWAATVALAIISIESNKF